MNINTINDPPCSSMAIDSGTSKIQWTTADRRRGGRKNGYGRLCGAGYIEETLFPLLPRRDLSGDTHWQRY